MKRAQWTYMGWWYQRWRQAIFLPWSRKKRTKEICDRFQMAGAEARYRAQQDREHNNPYVVTPLLFRIFGLLRTVCRLLCFAIFLLLLLLAVI